MAKLEKADQAFCFTSGMAALAAVTHLLQSGKYLIFASFTLVCTLIESAYGCELIWQIYNSQDKK
jgi:cystathionine beta-lyase/cystathionine gamma-synthase